MKKYVMSLAAATAALAVAAGARTGAAAQKAPFYQGKQIELLISHPAGGGMDTYARFLARYLGNYIPGHPRIIPQNMPGAAGIVMANSVSANQPADGTVIAFGPGAIASADLLKVRGAQFNAGKFSWIGSMSADAAVAVSWHTSPISTANQLFKQQLVVGAAGVTDQSTVYPTVLNRILGTKFKVIPGYEGFAAIALAMERGEVAGVGGLNYSSITADKPNWLRNHQIHILLQYALQRDPQLSSVPSVMDLAKGDDQRAVMKLIFSQTEISRLVFAPPGVPRAQLKILRTAFENMMSDKAVLADAAKHQITINKPASGEDVANLVDSLRRTRPEVIKEAIKATSVSE